MKRLICGLVLGLAMLAAPGAASADHWCPIDHHHQFVQRVHPRSYYVVDYSPRYVYPAPVYRNYGYPVVGSYSYGNVYYRQPGLVVQFGY